jgi:hypothetical protein
MTNKVKQQTLDDILNDDLSNIINNIDSREGIASVASILLNSLMNKERELFLRN